MPVRLLGTAVLAWPDAETVSAAARRWAADVAQGDAGVVPVGYFGSYARGDWGVGSDIDLVVVVEESVDPLERRAARWDTLALPVPADLLVYTRAEWAALASRYHDGGRHPLAFRVGLGHRRR